MIGLLMLLAAGTGLTPTYYSGTDLYKNCKDDPAAICMGYVAGVSDTFSDLAAAGLIRRPICIPQSVTLGQERDVVIQYLGDHPELRDNHGGEYLVYLALIKAYPCPQ